MLKSLYLFAIFLVSRTAANERALIAAVRAMRQRKARKARAVS